ncbi:MAG TPA: GGDEF domain-containing response regulator, partial [Solirubrobacteraceae bacterium]
MSRPVSMLLVEDNPADAVLVAEDLRDAPAPGFDVAVVGRLAVALQRLTRDRFDVVVIDLSLPDSGGLETFDAVASAAADTPVVVLSGLHDDHVAMHAVRRGAQDYLVKGRDEPGALAASLSAAIERHRTERELAHLANFDGLTGLPRRGLLERRLAAALGRADRDGRSLPLLHLELEGLDDLAVAHGIGAADGLRRAAAERVSAGLGPGDLLGHPDEEGLAVVAESVSQPSDAAALAERVLEAVGRPFTVEGIPVLTAGRVGIGVCPADGSAPSEALANARAAAHRATGGTYEFCDREMTELTRRRHAIEADLHDATRAGELVLHFQPVVRPGSGSVTAVEALLRWNHPRLGMLAPGEFIPVAERTGLIVELGEWALSAACWQMKAWDRQGLPHIGVSVNVSARQFASPSLVPAVEDALVATGLEPSRLELEVTESMLADPDGTSRTLARLRSIGVRVAIDDFGTGFSSLAYLRRFPIDTIKIDRSFVSPLGEDVHAADIVTAIIGLAHQLELGTVAEGVET